jgi:hypothetical protein
MKSNILAAGCQLSTCQLTCQLIGQLTCQLTCQFTCQLSERMPRNSTRTGVSLQIDTRLRRTGIGQNVEMRRWLEIEKYWRTGTGVDQDVDKN